MADVFDVINDLIDPSKGGGSEPPRSNQAKGVTDEQIVEMMTAPNST